LFAIQLHATDKIYHCVAFDDHCLVFCYRDCRSPQWTLGLTHTDETIQLIGIVIAMNEYDPPVRPGETYSQGFWHAIIAATLYLIGSMILMINMLGYFLGHYPQHFELDDDQRTLILQTMMFFFWLAGGAAVFAKVCGFTYADALYFCDVTVLTIGFGDIIPTNNAGRGIVFPYAVIGIIFLGLMINSIRKFASGMSKEKIIKKHQQNKRQRTYGRSVTNEKELRDRLGLPPRKESVAGIRRPSNTRSGSLANSLAARKESLAQYGHFDVHGRTITFHEHRNHGGGRRRGGARRNRLPLSHDAKMQQRKAKGSHARRINRRERLVLLREEKDRFDAMRDIQANTSKFKQYYSLAMSALAFGILWCVGAVVFWIAEHRIQNLSYFNALYFCYVSLLTIGYGDFSPRSNAGKPFFIVWSLVAIPTMTILISDMSDTVVSSINRGTFTLADWTVMPKAGVWKDFLDHHPKLRDWLERKSKEREAKKRIKHGFALQNPDEEAGGNDAVEEDNTPTLEKLAKEPELTEHDLARRLGLAIKRTANDLRAVYPKKYSYEEWVEFTQLIRFSSKLPHELEEEEEEEGLIEWDWIGEDSPMLADISESEWVLDRLCESLNRYTRKQTREVCSSCSRQNTFCNTQSLPKIGNLTSNFRPSTMPRSKNATQDSTSPQQIHPTATCSTGGKTITINVQTMPIPRTQALVLLD
jgi:potassium channel subfamily K